MVNKVTYVDCRGAIDPIASIWIRPLVATSRTCLDNLWWGVLETSPHQRSFISRFPGDEDQLSEVYDVTIEHFVVKCHSVNSSPKFAPLSLTVEIALSTLL